MKVTNFIPFSLFLATGLTLEWLSQGRALTDFGQGFFWWSLSFLLLINVAAAWLIAGRQHGKEWYKFALLPLNSTIAVLALMVIVGNTQVLQLLLWSLAVMIYVYWRSVFFYFYNQSRYTPFSLENLSFYSNFFLVMISGGAWLGLRSLLSLSFTLVAAIQAVWLASVIYQFFWVAKYEKEHWSLGMILWLLLTEVFVALMLLPHSHLMLGFVWATDYYLAVSLINDYIKKDLSKLKARLYLIITLVSWVLLFATAVWL